MMLEHWPRQDFDINEEEDFLRIYLCRALAGLHIFPVWYCECPVGKRNLKMQFETGLSMLGQCFGEELGNHYSSFYPRTVAMDKTINAIARFSVPKLTQLTLDNFCHVKRVHFCTWIIKRNPEDKCHVSPLYWVQQEVVAEARIHADVQWLTASSTSSVTLELISVSITEK